MPVSFTPAAPNGSPTSPWVAVIGAGPAGLMAAECISAAGVRVEVFDAMPSVARKFLLAGKGGMNLTHSEDFEAFCARYASRADILRPMLRQFGAGQLRAWAHGLGIDTFVGTSGRVFPCDMKAAPLLRAWMRRLREQGVVFHMRHRWLGWDNDALLLQGPEGRCALRPTACLLALGGASWPKLGSSAQWLPLLAGRGVDIAPLKPANCAFERPWSAHFLAQHEGAPVKPVVARCEGVDGRHWQQQGEFNITATGVEGGLIYALSAPLRDQLEASGRATLWLDLLPGKTEQAVAAEIAKPRGSRSMANHLRSRLGLVGVKAGLLRECTPQEVYQEPQRLASAIKALPVTLERTRPIDEAISSAGGVSFDALNAALMLTALPGVFCAGEMLDWEAPTGGYLLTACFATGVAAGAGILQWLAHPTP